MQHQAAAAEALAALNVHNTQRCQITDVRKTCTWGGRGESAAGWFSACESSSTVAGLRQAALSDHWCVQDLQG
jgi:hypothetical protein